MTFDLIKLADKLHRYREQFQISLEELSQSTGIALDDLIKFEAGIMSPNGDEILILADFYRCDYKFFISNERIAPFEQIEELFRIHGKEISRNDRWAIQDFLYLADCEEFLLESRQLKPTFDFSFKIVGDYYKKHGEEAANSLRVKLGYNENQIPIDIYHDFREMGLHIFRRKLENSNISGLFIKHPMAGKCILINYSEDIYRQRFSLAHEVGHSILDHSDYTVTFTTWDKNDLKEIRANTFAANYLLPKSIVLRLGGINSWDTKTVVYWANKFKVSSTTLAIALMNQNLIDLSAYGFIKSVKVPIDSKEDTELPSSLSTRARAVKEKLLEKGLSTYYFRLCLDSYRQNIITLSRMAEMLLIQESELVSIIELFGEQLDYDS